MIETINKYSYSVVIKNRNFICSTSISDNNNYWSAKTLWNVENLSPFFLILLQSFVHFVTNHQCVKKHASCLSKCSVIFQMLAHVIKLMKTLSVILWSLLQVLTGKRNGNVILVQCSPVLISSLMLIQKETIKTEKLD